MTSRQLKWILLSALMGATFFLASFNATIRFIIVDQPPRTTTTVSPDDDDDAVATAAAAATAGGDGDGDDDGVKESLLQRRQKRQNDIKTTTRPLDGFAQDAFFIDRETKTRKKYLQRRPPAAASAAADDAFHKFTSAADAHFDMAMRMLSSSPFGQGGGGGAGAAKMEDYYYYYRSSGKSGEKIGAAAGATTQVVNQWKDRTRQQPPQKQTQRRRMQQRRRRRRRRDDGTAVATTTTTTTTVDDNIVDDDGALVLEEIKNILLDFYETISDWIQDALGFITTTIDTPDTDSYYDENDTDDEYHYYYPSLDHRHHSWVEEAVDDSQEYYLFSWRDTTVGKQLQWAYSKVASLWHHRRRQEDRNDAITTTTTTGFDSTTTAVGKSLSRQDQIAWEGLFHLEKAAELGHSEAQRMVANSLASGILPISDHSLMRRVAEWKYYHHSRRQLALDDKSSISNDDESSGDENKDGVPIKMMMTNNWTSILLQSTLQVPDDYSSTGAGAGGGEQLSRAILLWHLSAMAGNVESAMALGYRHLYSAAGGLTQTFISKPLHHQSHVLDDDAAITVGFHPVHGGVIGGQQSRADGGGGGGGGGGDITNTGGGAGSHYGVLGTCHSALAYYEAAAHGIMDELESGPTKGKVNLPIEDHRLLEIFNIGGASSALARHNKYDESEEALQYYHLLAIGSRSHDPDSYAAHTLATLYYHGIRGVKQDLRLALKYLEICADYQHKECGGQAGLMHVWSIGMTPEERDLGKAYNYFVQGTTGKLEYCIEQWRRKRKQTNKSAESEGEIELCDRHSVNGMGLLHLFGLTDLINRDVNVARRWFEHGKDIDDPDSMYNYAMLHLGWMVSELDDLPTNITVVNSADDEQAGSSGHHSSVFEQNYMTRRKAPSESNNGDKYTGPSVSDYNIAIQQLKAAAKNGHLQAKHKLGMLYATGATVPRKNGRPTKVVHQSCPVALRYFKSVAENGHTFHRRNLAAWKQYVAGDYESSLRNYLASAETGSEVGQVNAAFLLEQGYCLGMTATACTHASIRLWRAAARQGNLEACLRVGDFYFYGRMLKSRGGTATVYDQEEFLTSLTPKALFFVPGPYRWARYALYPEELFHLTSKQLFMSLSNLWQYISVKLLGWPVDDQKESVHTLQNVCFGTMERSCLPNWISSNGDDNAIDGKAEEHNHMVIAAQYYRKAADEFKSARGHFNLGFMHEWGLGLTQDFPLAKRHYDLAKENNANMAAAFALFAMDIHQMALKAAINLKNYFGMT